MRQTEMASPIHSTEIKSQLEELKNDYKSMILSTKTANQDVESSYAPYLYFNNKYYIILSKIATHYDNIQTQKSFQGMILEDESKAVNIFFRKRAIFNFDDANQTANADVIQAFIDTHGAIVEKLLTMNFDIFELNVLNGRIILGAGKAFTFNPEEINFEQITGDHKRK